jgi:hypothetical protein
LIGYLLFPVLPSMPGKGQTKPLYYFTGVCVFKIQNIDPRIGIKQFKNKARSVTYPEFFCCLGDNYRFFTMGTNFGITV